jgi:hypothetical protein
LEETVGGKAVKQSCSLLAFGIVCQTAFAFVAASVEVEKSNSVADLEASVLCALAKLMNVAGSFVTYSERLL